MFSSSRQVCSLLAALLLSACAAAPNLVGLSQIRQTQDQTPSASVQNLFIATSRMRSKDATEFFSGERSQTLALASVDVTIPTNHTVGQIEQPTSGKPDPSRHFTIAKPLVFNDNASFQARLANALESRAPGDRSVLVFVHGYNTNFSAAVLRMAQFVHDSGFRGVPVLFTWASRGRALDYAYDTNSALQARFYLMQLANILADTKAESFSLVAHSMGNLVTLETMSTMVKSGFQSKTPLNSVILASPDVDIDLFREHMRVLGPIRDRMFVLISRDDRALRLSRTIAGGVNRAGDADPESVARLGVAVLDLSKINDTSSANHSKFADSPDIVQLIGRRISAGNTLATNETAPVGALVGSAFQGFRRITGGSGGGGQGSVLTLGNDSR